MKVDVLRQGGVGGFGDAPGDNARHEFPVKRQGRGLTHTDVIEGWAVVIEQNDPNQNSGLIRHLHRTGFLQNLDLRPGY